ncbi:hypothetical protein [Nocardioides ultimimeridianus]
MLATPVVLIVFNRPDLTRRLLEAVRAARPRHLLVVADGPRPDRPEDAPRCAEVRALVDDFAARSGETRVESRFSERNLGVEGNVETGLDWVFERVERAIVLEDDCLPDLTFFRFCEELLDRYADDRRVWQVAGNGLGVPQALFGDDSYAFTAWASVWGWATWAARWQRHRALFPRDHAASGHDRGDRPVRTRPVDLDRAQLVTRGARRHFAEAAASTDVVTHGWDKHWWLTVMAEGGLCVTPAHSLVENVGFGEHATHTTGGGADYGRARPAAFPLRHPARVELAVEVERELELVLGRVGGRAARLARRVVRSPRMRTVLRSAADSGPAVAAVRTISRWTDRKAGR